MAGYWPSSFFAFLWTETKSRSIKTQKRTRPISSHLNRTSLVNNGFIIRVIWDETTKNETFFLRDQARNLERAVSTLSRSGSHSHRGIWFIFPVHWAGNIIITAYWQSARAVLWNIGPRSWSTGRAQQGPYCPDWGSIFPSMARASSVRSERSDLPRLALPHNNSIYHISK